MATSFDDLHLDQQILRALKAEGYTEPTEIQQKAIPIVLGDQDLLATAQTGTGKTAAFALPILHLLSTPLGRRPKGPRALILSPTRELAQQIEHSLRSYGRYLRVRITSAVGGVPIFPQIRNLRRGPDILVATPGRLLDLYRNGHVTFQDTEIFVLDEADQMLDMGFIPDIKLVVSKLNENRQTLMFSATMSPKIAALANGILEDPTRIDIAPSGSVAENIDQHVLFVDKSKKYSLLLDILKAEDVERTIIFTRTKRQADQLSTKLSKDGIRSDSIHSDKRQGARQKALRAFDRGALQVLVGTDVIARGIDVDDISHIINFEMPENAESYVHRIGRTARAGSKGTAISMCDFHEISSLQEIEALTQNTIPVFSDHGYHSDEIESARDKRGSAPAKRRSGKRSFSSKKRPTTQYKKSRSSNRQRA